MGRAILDPDNPPTFTAEDLARLDAMTEEEIERNALEDPDNPPMTEEELDRVRAARFVQSVREARGMSQSAFAETYGIAVGRLQEWERGRSEPDPMARAYLDVIRHEPEAVARARRKAAGV